MSENYLNLLPRLNGENKGTIEEHISVFQEFTDNIMVEDEDVFIFILRGICKNGFVLFLLTHYIPGMTWKGHSMSCGVRKRIFNTISGNFWR